MASLKAVSTWSRRLGWGSVSGKSSSPVPGSARRVREYERPRIWGISRRRADIAVLKERDKVR